MENVAETVIADFLGDIEDGHERIKQAVSGRTSYERWRALAKVLLADLKDSRVGIVNP